MRCIRGLTHLQDLQVVLRGVDSDAITLKVVETIGEVCPDFRSVKWRIQRWLRHEELGMVVYETKLDFKSVGGRWTSIAPS